MDYLLIFILGSGITYFIFNYKKKKPKESASSEVKKEKPILSEDEKAIENLLSLEEFIAVNGSLPVEIKKLSDELFSLLYEVIPELVQFRASEIGFEINQMANEHLSARVKAFMKLSTSDKENKHTSLIDDISKFKEYVLKAKKIIDLNDVSKDERESMLIDIKY